MPLNLQHELFVIDARLAEKIAPKMHKKIVDDLIDSLLKELDMKILGPLSIYEATDLRAPGWSFIQPITTSHIAGHYFEGPEIEPHIHMDIYSCSPLNFKEILTVLNQYLPITDWQGTFIIRHRDWNQRTVTGLVGKHSQILHEYNMHAENAHMMRLLRELKLSKSQKILAGVQR